MGSVDKRAISLVLISWVTLATTSTLIPVRECGKGVPAPTSVTMECDGMSHGTCLLEKGKTHRLIAEFTPGVSSSRLQSYVAWKSWVEMPLPGQNSNACQNYIDCPVNQGTQTNFTYPLEIQNFWMRRRYPMIWKLTNQDTEETVLCFVFRIQIA